MTSIELVTLGEVADLQWGDTSVTKKSYVLTGDKYPAYSASGKDGFLPYFDYDRTGVILSAIGANAGKTWLATGKWSCIKNTIRFFSKDESVADTRYLYWATQSHATFPLRGSAQPFISQGDAREVAISLPPIPEQRAIAATLGALDDKIESNQRAIDLARQLTQSQYHAAAKHRVTASEVLTPVLGGTPRRDVADYWDGEIKWASAKDIAGAIGGFVIATAETVSTEGVNNSAAKIMPAGTIVMTARGTVGALARLAEPMAFNQSCYGLRSDSGWEASLLAALESSVNRIKDSGHGTVFNTINMSTFDQIELDVLDDHELNIVLESLSRKILQFLQENERLTKVRDSLLPELLSGRIRVPVEGAKA